MDGGGGRGDRPRRARRLRCAAGAAGEDPELGSAVLGETTGSDEPATEAGVDAAAGDEADATSDGGPDLTPGAEPDLKDVAAAQREADRVGRLRLVQTPAPFEYERATSVEGAIASLQKLGSEARIIAGGHSLLPMMKLRLANPTHLIDINDLTDLSYIREQGDEIRSGR